MSRLNWEQILRRAAKIVAEYATVVTLRQLHYRLVSAPELGYPNTTSAYKALSARTADGRRQGTFPPLADLTRSIVVPFGYASPREALEYLADGYQEIRTEGQLLIPAIVVEKATLVAQLKDWFGDPLGVPIFPLRGYSSESYERDVRDYLRRRNRSGCVHSAIYLGDFDPSGEDIERNARRYLGDCFESWTRIAITDAQIERYELPENPGKTTDSRAAGFEARHGRLVQVEIEALDPAELRALVADAVEANWDTSVFKDVMAREEEGRALFRELAAAQT